MRLPRINRHAALRGIVVRARACNLVVDSGLDKETMPDRLTSAETYKRGGRERALKQPVSTQGQAGHWQPQQFVSRRLVSPLPASGIRHTVGRDRAGAAPRRDWPRAIREVLSLWRRRSKQDGSTNPGGGLPGFGLIIKRAICRVHWCCSGRDVDCEWLTGAW